MTVNTIQENGYREKMEGLVEPELAAIRKVQRITTNGQQVACDVYLPENARGIVLLLHGFTESAEKFREMAWVFLQEGYGVFAPDHVGHGRSGRLVQDSSLVHIDRFMHYAEDMENLIRELIVPELHGRPLMLYGHSMGGAVAACLLIRNPGMFARAILTSPMIAPSSPIPLWVGRALSKWMERRGKGNRMAFVGKAYSKENDTFEASCDTSRARFDYYWKKRADTVAYQTNGPSYTWVREAIDLRRFFLDAQNAGKITTPFLLCQAGQDTIVSQSDQNRFVALTRCGNLVRFERAKHEIYMSEDETQRLYLSVVKAYLGQPFDR